MNIQNYVDILLEQKEVICSSKDYGIHNGKSGLLLFLLCFGEVNEDYREEEIGKLITIIFEDLIVYVQHQIDLDSSNELSFCEGLAGIAWCIDTMRESNFLDLDGEYLIAFDSILLKYAEILIKLDFWDPLYGLIGIGHYFIKREIKGGVLLILDFLTKNKNLFFEGSFFWRKNLDQDSDPNLKMVDLGVAHGNAGILLFLIKCHEKDLYKEISSPLIKDLCQFYNLTQQNDAEIQSLWKYFIYEDELKNNKISFQESRIGWCYGDLVILYALYQAARILNDKDYENIILDKLILTGNRKSREQTNIENAYFCHGSAGLVSIFDQLFKISSRNEFKILREYWINDMNENYERDGSQNLWLDKNYISVLNGSLGPNFVQLHVENYQSIDYKSTILSQIFFL
ncbi:MAG: lanthionine synthetase LanC family protein [Sphingobacterium sp.]